MGEIAGRTAVVHGGSRAGGMDEPGRVASVGSAATGFRGSRRLEEDLRYSWLEDYLVRLDGKEARREYYLWLE